MVGDLALVRSHKPGDELAFDEFDFITLGANRAFFKRKYRDWEPFRPGSAGAQTTGVGFVPMIAMLTALAEKSLCHAASGVVSESAGLGKLCCRDAWESEERCRLKPACQLTTGRRAQRKQIRFAKPGYDASTLRVQLQFVPGPTRESAEAGFLSLNGRRIALLLVRNLRARRYLLRLRSDGCAQVTIPRGGSAAEARRFVDRNLAWLEREVRRLAMRPARPKEWRLGNEIMLRGELVRIEPCSGGDPSRIRFSGEALKVSDVAADLRPAVERYLWRLACKELPPRVLEFATQHRESVSRVTVRNQRTRWGSCSRRGTISLNWRLVQSPPFVRDYIILHELMHLREMNHSVRFWREVERACPDYRVAERWLKQHSILLR